MLINANWLKKNIKKENIKTIDASWYLPNSNKNSLKEYYYSHIPNAVFFDINKICKKNTSLPHMMPQKKYFESSVSKLGISAKDIIIIYCKDGVASSPRVWLSFKYFGHKNVYILNGGFRAWRLVNGEHQRSCLNKSFKPYKSNRIKKNLIITYQALRKVYKIKKNFLIIDCRPAKRFLGEAPEPRSNIGKGNILGSINVPHNKLQLKGFLKFKSSLKKILKKENINNKLIICSCGSGISACNLAAALQYIGVTNYTIYDGSWTEWYLKTIG